jgi:hypothetical protein
VHCHRNFDYAKIYGWLQFVLQQKPTEVFAKRIDSILRYCRAPYRVIDAEVICPVGSDTEAETITKAFVDLKSTGLAGSKEHLKAAVAELTAGNFSDSVRESIHAVESGVRVLEPSGDFSKSPQQTGTEDEYSWRPKKGVSSPVWFFKR